MRLVTRLLVILPLTLALGLSVAPGALRAQSGPCCIVPDVNGTADHPPSCQVGYTGLMQVLNGLPSGSSLQAPSDLGGGPGFMGLTQVPGGALGGMDENWNAILVLQLSGTGVFLGYNRTVSVAVVGETYSAPRIPFTTPQTFATDLFRLQGQLPPGDPDFDLLRITAGTGFGLPSPGLTTFAQLAGGWAPDSFFDITWRIDFIGHPGGPFGGMSGSTTGTSRFALCHSDPTTAKRGSWGALKVLYR